MNIKFDEDRENDEQLNDSMISKRKKKHAQKLGQDEKFTKPKDEVNKQDCEAQLKKKRSRLTLEEFNVDESDSTLKKKSDSEASFSQANKTDNSVEQLYVKKKKKKKEKLDMALDGIENALENEAEGNTLVMHEQNGVSEESDLITLKMKKKKKKSRLASEKVDAEEVDPNLEETDFQLKKKLRKLDSEDAAVTEIISLSQANKTDNSVEQLYVKKKKKKKAKSDTTLDGIENALEEEAEGNTLIMHEQNDVSEQDDVPIKKKKKKRKSRLASENVDAEEVHPNLEENDYPVKKKLEKSNSKDPVVTETILSGTANEEIDQNATPITKNTGKRRNKIKKDTPTENVEMDAQSSANTTTEHVNFDSSIYHDAVDGFEELIPIDNKGRPYTVSIAIPASILHETCLTQEFRTYIVGQIARSACIYSVDEIIVYDDKCWKNDSYSNAEDYIGMMSMVLEYQECPQYLRKNFFPMHPYLRNTGALNAVNASHHLLAHEWCQYREGVIMAKQSADKRSSYAYVGFKDFVEVDRKLEPGVRVTVNFPPELSMMRRKIGCVVSQDEPRTKAGLYWGYTVRVATSLKEVFKSERFKEGYDLIIGTSDKGSDAADAEFSHFSHALIVFGGVAGLEAAMEADEKLTASKPTDLFPLYLNVCPNQSSRTIRTEEAVLISLSVLSPKLAAKGKAGPS